MKNRGFVLVLTLWILAAMTIAVGFFALWVQRALASAADMQADVQAQIDMHGTRQTFFYLLTSRWFTMAGITLPETDDQARLEMYSNDDAGRNYGTMPVGTEIRLDDLAYQGLGAARFAVQDQDGLLSLDAANPFTSPRIFERFLDLLGIDGEQRDPLLAKLADYQDADDFHRLNGAEAYHYQEAGRLPPSNRQLHTPLEAKLVLDWPEQAPLWRDGIWEHLTKPHGNVYVNVNTAPVIVMRTVYGWPPELAQKVAAARPIIDHSVLAGLGVPMDERNEPPMILAFTDFRLTLWNARSATMQRLFFRLDHDAPQAPWQVQYVYDFPLRAEYREATPIALNTALLTDTD